MNVPEGDIDVLAIGEMLVDFISVEETGSLCNVYAFRDIRAAHQLTLPCV